MVMAADATRMRMAHVYHGFPRHSHARSRTRRDRARCRFPRQGEALAHACLAGLPSGSAGSVDVTLLLVAPRLRIPFPLVFTESGRRGRDIDGRETPTGCLLPASGREGACNPGRCPRLGTARCVPRKQTGTVTSVQGEGRLVVSNRARQASGGKVPVTRGDSCRVRVTTHSRFPRLLSLEDVFPNPSR